MKTFELVVIALLCEAIVFGIGVFGQWLAWHGPEWIKVTGQNGDSTLSFAIAGPMIILALVLQATAIAAALFAIFE